MHTLDAVAAERHSSRSAVVKDLVDQAEKARFSELFSGAYESGGAQDVDDFGDLGAFHGEVEKERVPFGEVSVANHTIA